MDNCIFCKIVKGEIPSKKIYEDDQVMAFYDVAPAAPVHVLVIPKEHVLESARAITAEHAALSGYIYQVIAKLADELGVDLCGILLGDGDIVVGAEKAEEGKTLLTVTVNGFGKRTELQEYLRTGPNGEKVAQSRGGKGLKNYNIN